MIFLDAKDYDHYICCGNTDMRLVLSGTLLYSGICTVS